MYFKFSFILYLLVISHPPNQPGLVKINVFVFFLKASLSWIVVVRNVLWFLVSPTRGVLVFCHVLIFVFINPVPNDQKDRNWFNTSGAVCSNFQKSWKDKKRKFGLLLMQPGNSLTLEQRQRRTELRIKIFCKIATHSTNKASGNFTNQEFLN